ncbi:MAG: peroxiredoxin family protein [Desulfonatronovibrio sp.]
MFKKSSLLKIVFLWMVVLLIYPATCLSKDIPATGDMFPSNDLETPQEKAYQNYLELDGSMDTFKLRDIDADLVLVQILSMYCPICQREAEHVNELFEIIEQDKVADRVKIIGIAPGNSEFEVSVFREKYDIPFPIIPDADYEWHKIMGEAGTPYFLLVDLDSGKILEDNLGPFGTPQEFYETIIQHMD